jgi:hypothetical protein
LCLKVFPARLPNTTFSGIGGSSHKLTYSRPGGQRFFYTFVTVFLVAISLGDLRAMQRPIHPQTVNTFVESGFFLVRRTLGCPNAGDG